MTRSRGSYNGGSTIIGPRSTGWFGRGSVTSQSASTKQARPQPAKAKKKKNKVVNLAPKQSSGAGLTRAEKIAKAHNKVEALEANIEKTKKLLGDFGRQLVEARGQLARAQASPRRSALGQALAAAQESRLPRTSS